MQREGKTAAQLYDSFENWPQVLVNVKLDHKEGWDKEAMVVESLCRANTALDGNGRINVRASGTQPIVRVMVESSSAELCESVSREVVETLTTCRGGSVYSRVDLAHDLGE